MQAPNRPVQKIFKIEYLSRFIGTGYFKIFSRARLAGHKTHSVENCMDPMLRTCMRPSHYLLRNPCFHVDLDLRKNTQCQQTYPLFLYTVFSSGAATEPKPPDVATSDSYARLSPLAPSRGTDTAAMLSRHRSRLKTNGHLIPLSSSRVDTSHGTDQPPRTASLHTGTV